MSAIIELLSGPLGSFLMAIVIFVGGGAFMVQRGRRKERDKQMRERLRARERADDIEEAVAGRPVEENRERLKARWPNP